MSISYPCFHTNSAIGRVAISSCEIRHTENSTAHVTILKDPINPHEIYVTEKIKFQNAKGAIMIFEEYPQPLLCDLLSLLDTTNPTVIYDLMNQIADHFLYLTTNRLIHPALVGKSGDVYCKNLAAVSICDGSATLHHTFNFLLQSQKVTVQKLVKQLSMYPIILRSLLFRPASKKSSHINACCTHCKLKPYEPRFISKELYEFVHKMFCTVVEGKSFVHALAPFTVIRGINHCVESLSP